MSHSLFYYCKHHLQPLGHGGAVKIFSQRVTELPIQSINYRGYCRAAPGFKRVCSSINISNNQIILGTQLFRVQACGQGRLRGRVTFAEAQTTADASMFPAHDCLMTVSWLSHDSLIQYSVGHVSVPCRPLFAHYCPI